MTDDFTIICGDALAETRKFPTASVDCVITSPPYWHIRDYGFAGQWGLEATFTEFLENLWSLMDEIRRVLKPEGTAWVNLGDTYASDSKWGGTTSRRISQALHGADGTRAKKTSGVADKSLLMLPHRFAIGCSDRGWIVRNDIVWAKRNALPEPVGDRFSKKHEYLFLMAKQGKYYFDLDAIRDQVKIDSIKRNLRGNSGNAKYAPAAVYSKHVHAPTMSQKRDYQGYDELQAEIEKTKGKNPGTCSDFWDLPPARSKANHYATFSVELIDKPILAGSPRWICPKCKKGFS